MLYLTSDLHFHHKNILDWSKETRPWDSVEEMNEGLIEAWNKTVRPNDTIYHLGDFSFSNANKTRPILERLNGNKVFIWGNHEYRQNKKLMLEFGEGYDYKEIKHEGDLFCLFHYPIMNWKNRHYGAYHFFGHVHGGYKDVNMGRALDVGWDSVGKIISIDEAKELVKDNPYVYYGSHHEKEVD